jgi:hypothetical protein
MQLAALGSDTVKYLKVRSGSDFRYFVSSGYAAAGICFRYFGAVSRRGHSAASATPGCGGDGVAGALRRGVHRL